MLLWALQQTILGESGAWLEYIWWYVNLVFVGNLSSPVKSFVTQILSDLTCFCQQSHQMINEWCLPGVWLCKMLICCIFSDQLYNVCRALSRTSKKVVCFMVEPMSSFMCRVEWTCGEYCSFPTVIKSYDPHDSSIVLYVEARDRCRGQWERVRSKFRCASGVNAVFCVPSSLKRVQKVPCALSGSS